MAKAEKSSRSQRDADSQEMDRKKEEARLAAVEGMNEKMKGAGWRPSPKRGDVKKRIAKDFTDSLKACARIMKNSYTATVQDECVSFTEEDVRYITILRDIEQDVEGPQTGPDGIGVGAMN